MLSRNLLVGVSVLALAAQAASAQTTRTGTNLSTVNRVGSGNSGEASQTGNDNIATLEQIGDGNSSRIRQAGDANDVLHRQRGNRNRADSEQQGNRHASNVTQQGNENSATVLQLDGNRNSSTIEQGTSVEESPGDQLIPGNRNAARVTQRGSDNEAIVFQRDTGNTAPGTQVSDNVATVMQGTATLRSNGAFAFIQQESRGNTAEIFQFEGVLAETPGPANNGGFIIQRHFGAENTADPMASERSNNRASLAMRGFGNAGGIFQNGRDNFAELTMLGGGTASSVTIDAETQRSQGNSSFIDQSGTGLSAQVVGGARPGEEGQGNFSNLQQRGNRHRALIWQRGLFDTNAILQQNGPDTGTYAGGAQARAFADVSQKGLRNTVSIEQTGDNAAEVTQGLGTRSRVEVAQTDAGDVAGARALNRVGIAQFGDFQVATVTQNALNASGNVFQQAGPAGARSRNNSAVIEQGTGSTGTASFSAAFFGNSAAGQTGPNSRNLVANIVQGNNPSAASRNSAEVRQDGVSLAATIEQAGTGTAASPNRVRIGQQGSNNSAIARQLAGVAASASGAPASGQQGDEFFFAGGSRSAEITILQRSSGNSATVEQRGTGQLARIEQSGMSNAASILQGGSATNATAVIRQSGNGNSYSVTQDQPGQFILVQQTGNNNAVTTLVRRGPGS